MFRTIIIICILFIGIPVNAELSLKPVHPEEPVDYTYTQRFSFQHSLQVLNQIRSALESFRKLTEVSEGNISKMKLKEIGNTGWSAQNLGFMNWTGAIEGTLYKQEYLIKKLHYELTLEKVRSGQLNKDDLIYAEKEFEQAEKNFQDFWNSFSIGD